MLTHWGRVTHICVSKLTITGPDNGLSPGRRQAIIWTNAGMLLVRTLGTNLSEILIKINTVSLKKMHLKMSSGRRQPSCLGLNVLIKRCSKGVSKGCNFNRWTAVQIRAWMSNHIPKGCMRVITLWKSAYLTHWDRDKMAAVSQTTFSDAFSWMKMYEFRLRFHWSLFLRFKLPILQHWCR